MSNLSQKSFAGGVLSPALHGNTNLARYQYGLRTGRNGYIEKTGGFTNRVGSEYLSIVRHPSINPRLIKFVFNADQTYLLEFNSQSIRFYKNGVLLKAGSPKSITGITNGAECEITVASHGYATNDDVYLEGIVGMPELNNQWFRVINTGTNTFKILNFNSDFIDSTAFGTYSSGGLAQTAYVVATPYLPDDLDGIDYSQSADVITLVHPSHQPRELRRFGDTNWTLDIVDFMPSTDAPSGFSKTGSAGAGCASYLVTAVNAITGEESLCGFTSETINITGISNANPGVFTLSAGITGSQLRRCRIEGIVGMTELNGVEGFPTNNTTSTEFRAFSAPTTSIDTTNFGTYVSGGVIRLCNTIFNTFLPASPSTPIFLSWTPLSNAPVSHYNVYRNSLTGSFFSFGLIGRAFFPSFSDTGIDIDFTIAPPNSFVPFPSANNYPSTTIYSQQRRFFANTNNNPETIWGSRIGSFSNFIQRIPLTDDGPINATIPNRHVSEIRFLIEIDNLIAMTNGSEVALRGTGDGFLLPTAINAKAQSYNGSAAIKPVVSDNTVLYIQNGASIIRDLLFEWQSQGYRGNDLTVFANHFFEGFTLVDMDFQKKPHPILWVVRSDGKVLSCSYDRANDLIAWTIHDWSNATVKRVCVLPEGGEDRVYFTIQRSIGGYSRKYVERLNPRLVTNLDDAHFMDSWMRYDGRSNPNHTVTISGGTDWDYNDTLTVTTSVSMWTAADIGNEVHITGPDGTLIRVEITGYTSGFTVTGKPDKTVPVSMRGVAIAGFKRAVDEIINLWHLEGKQVTVWGDSFLVANPNNASYDVKTVTNGTITLDRCYGVIYVGLPFITDIETLDIDTSSSGRDPNASQIITEVGVRVRDSLTFWAGSGSPSDDSLDPLEGLYELKLRSNESLDSAVSLSSEVHEIKIQSTYNKTGRVFLRNIDPVPFNVLSIRPTGLIK